MLWQVLGSLKKREEKILMSIHVFSMCEPIKEITENFKRFFSKQE